MRPCKVCGHHHHGPCTTKCAPGCHACNGIDAYGRDAADYEPCVACAVGVRHPVCPRRWLP